MEEKKNQSQTSENQSSENTTNDEGIEYIEKPESESSTDSNENKKGLLPFKKKIKEKKKPSEIIESKPQTEYHEEKESTERIKKPYKISAVWGMLGLPMLILGALLISFPSECANQICMITAIFMLAYALSNVRRVMKGKAKNITLSILGAIVAFAVLILVLVFMEPISQYIFLICGCIWILAAAINLFNALQAQKKELKIFLIVMVAIIFILGALLILLNFFPKNNVLSIILGSLNMAVSIILYLL